MPRHFIFNKTASCLTALAAVFSLASCEKNIAVELPQQPPRLSMISEVAAGDTFRIQVGHTVSIKQSNGSVNMGVDNAIPLLYENDVLVDTLKPYSQGAYIYSGKTRAVAGKTYRVDISAPDYVMASATETVPVTVPIQLVSHTPNARTANNGPTQDEVVFSFDDPAAPGDYYIMRIVNYDGQSIYSYGGYCINTADVSAESVYSSDVDDIDINTCLSSNTVFFRDDLFNGKHKEVKFYIDNNALMPWPDSNGNNMYPKLMLVHVPASYYRFLKSYFGASDVDGNPFAEPFNITTNVSNGYGIFSVTTSSAVEVK